jgi:hypothetical protein
MPWRTGDLAGWGERVASMERTGASVEELARETAEEILGYRGEPGTGHRPPRADIQKMKDAHDLHQLAYGTAVGLDAKDEQREHQQAWREKYGLGAREI